MKRTFDTFSSLFFLNFLSLSGVSQRYSDNGKANLLVLLAPATNLTEYEERSRHRNKGIPLNIAMVNSMSKLKRTYLCQMTLCSSKTTL